MKDLLRIFNAQGGAGLGDGSQTVVRRVKARNRGLLRSHVLDDGTRTTTREVMARVGCSYRSAVQRLQNHSDPVTVFAALRKHPGSKGRTFDTSEGPRTLTEMTEDARNIHGLNKYTLRYRCIKYGPGIPASDLYQAQRNGRKIT